MSILLDFENEINLFTLFVKSYEEIHAFQTKSFNRFLVFFSPEFIELFKFWFEQRSYWKVFREIRKDYG